LDGHFKATRLVYLDLKEWAPHKATVSAYLQALESICAQVQPVQEAKKPVQQRSFERIWPTLGFALLGYAVIRYGQGLVM
jgi:hypothetical protein